jgi:hypothetical protein
VTFPPVVTPSVRRHRRAESGEPLPNNAQENVAISSSEKRASHLCALAPPGALVSKHEAQSSPRQQGAQPRSSSPGPTFLALRGGSRQ